jgi:hypothetical protein
MSALYTWDTSSNRRSGSSQNVFLYAPTGSWIQQNPKVDLIAKLLKLEVHIKLHRIGTQCKWRWCFDKWGCHAIHHPLTVTTNPGDDIACALLAEYIVCRLGPPHLANMSITLLPRRAICVVCAGDPVNEKKPVMWCRHWHYHSMYCTKMASFEYRYAYLRSILVMTWHGSEVPHKQIWNTIVLSLPRQGHINYKNVRFELRVAETLI